MAEIALTPLTDEGPQLLDRLQAEGQLYPFRTTRAGLAATRSAATRSGSASSTGYWTRSSPTGGRT